jgi:Caspase domain
MSDRVALLIGNSDYPKSAALKNPTNDAKDLAKKLRLFGFATTTVTDGTKREMETALDSFKKRLDKAKVGLMFFAGHGFQGKGENYLVAVDSKTTGEIEARNSSLSLNLVIETMEDTATDTNIIILDACRNNPFERAWARSLTSRGLAPVYAPKGTLIAYATSPGQTASDGDGRNGAYTASLLQHLDAVDCSIETMFKRVRNTLSASTSGKQISWEHTSLAKEFYFNRSVGVRIDLYDSTALRDKFFELDLKKSSHRAVEGLRVRDWYTQNPALDEFTESKMARAGTDSLFVVGRNIYQAACGGSRSAHRFLNDFHATASRLPMDKSRALLDGMLFEVFFDSKGELREETKIDHFEELFALQQYASLSESFKFISECLIPYSHRLHLLPGRDREVSVDITTRQKGDDIFVEGVLLGGSNIFWVKGFDDDEGDLDDERPLMRSVSRLDFEKELAHALLLPTRLLKVSYPIRPDVPRKFKVPYHWTIETKH